MSEPTSEQERRGLSQRFFAWWYRNAENDPYDHQVEARKQALLGGLQGLVVEIGPGTGANFPYFAKNIRWIGIEPNAFMHDDLRETAREYGFTPDIRAAAAEKLPLEDASVDAVVSTLVMCSVDDQMAALREILRVLKPGGSYVFMEHVAAPRGTWMRRWQGIIKPVWKIVGDGCRPDRETWVSIQKAGFSRVELEHFRVPMWLASPHIAGTAIK